MWLPLPCCTCGQGNPNAFRIGCRGPGCGHSVCMVCGYKDNSGDLEVYYCVHCFEPERELQHQRQCPQVTVEVPSLPEVLSNWLSSSSSDGLMFQNSGVLRVLQQLVQSCCQCVTPPGRTLDGVGKRTRMLGSLASSLVATSALIAPFLLACACVVLATLTTFWAPLWFAFAVVTISAHVLFWQSRRLIRMGCERKSGGALALRRYVAEAEMKDKAAILRESRKAREELSAKRGESTGRGRGALGRCGRGTSTGSADDG